MLNIMLPAGTAAALFSTMVCFGEPLPLRQQSSPFQFQEVCNPAGGLIFHSHSAGYALELGSQGSLSIRSTKAVDADVTAIQWLGATQSAAPQGVSALPVRINTIKGSDPSKWCLGQQAYSGVVYRDLYPGVELTLYANEAGVLEFDLTLAPGANPQAVRFRLMHSARIEKDDQGGLKLGSATSSIRLGKPHTFQTDAGSRREIASGFQVSQTGEVSFRLDSYNTALPLIIDPVLTYSTYLGGDSFDTINAATVDSNGTFYMAGETYSASFTPGSGSRSSKDLFVTKLNQAGTGYSFTTILGGSDQDSAQAIAVDGAGNVYLTGTTLSRNFPVTPGSLQSSAGGLQDAFVVKLDANGVLRYATYLGAQGSDVGTGIAVDASGSAHVTGYTSSTNFPTTAGTQQRALAGGAYDAFLAKLDPSGSVLLYSTLLGGSGTDIAHAIALDHAGNAYVVGQTDSNNFPVQAALQPANKGDGDAFISKVDPAGRLIYSTYLGGLGVDLASAVAVDSDSNAYISGSTSSIDFPVSASAFQGTIKGLYDSFAAKINASGTALVYATYIGGSGSDTATGIVVDSGGNAWICGFTSSSDYPVQKPTQAVSKGNIDGFVTVLDSVGAQARYSTYLGGTGDDRAYGIGLAGGSAYVAGFTSSTDFPTTAGATQISSNGIVHGFISKITIESPPSVVSVTPSGGVGRSQVFSFAYSDPDGASDITLVQVLFAPSLSGNAACFLYFDPGSNKLWLSGDQGTGWSGGLSPGTAGNVQNSQCILDAAGSSISAAGNYLTVNLALTFKPAFQGTKVVYTEVGDSWNQYAGWPSKGTWTIPGNQAPAVVSVSPAAGKGRNQIFSFLYRDPDGATDITLVQMVFNTGLVGSNGCFVYYDPLGNRLWLSSDQGTGWYGGYTPGSAGIVQNSQCALDAARSSVVASGNDLGVNLALSFKSGFAGPKTIYSEVGDSLHHYAGWPVVGSWTVGDSAPAAVSVTPSAGTGTQQTFSFLYSDSDSASDITLIQVVVNSTLSAAQSCFIYYDPPSNKIWLAPDSGAGWIGGLVPNSPGTVQNSQCILDAARSSVLVSGNSLTLNLGLTFQPAFRGPKNIYTEAGDASNQYAGWPLRGVWNVP